MSGLSIKDISVGVNNACVIASNNKAYCWGLNGAGYGRLGNNKTAVSLVPTAVYDAGALNGLNIEDISVGTDHACVVASDKKHTAGEVALMASWVIILRPIA